MNRTTIWELIELFRKSKFYAAVINSAYLAKYAGIHLGSYIDEPDDEFLKDSSNFLVDNTTLGKKKVEAVFENNSADTIKSAFELILEEEIEPIEFLDTFLELENCNLHFASYLLNLASEGLYVIYEESIYKAMIDLLPDFKENPKPATDGVTYMYFQMACDAIIETFRFTSVHELFWFLWHGQRTTWKFA